MTAKEFLDKAFIADIVSAIVVVAYTVTCILSHRYDRLYDLAFLCLGFLLGIRKKT